ncbi:chorismate mutase [Streptomyces sp. 049-1]|uniref:chorismate mutase n=1 Tax=Streptomyces sp. 049-1 TaxID=2789264 RepID=UPI00398077DB
MCPSTVGSPPLGSPQPKSPSDTPQTGPRTSLHSRAETQDDLGMLTELVIRRLLIGDQVAASKFGTGRPIDDPAREHRELELVRHQARRSGLGPDKTTVFFRNQIGASKIVQRGLFAHWAAHPDQIPATRPDLNAIRARLDRLTGDLLDELKRTQHLRSAPTDCAGQLARSVRAGSVLYRLDGLHRQALEIATRSVCGSA